MSVQLNALADHKRQLLEKIAGQRLLLHSQIAGYQKPLQALNAAHGFANGIGEAFRRHGIAIAIAATVVALVVVRGGLAAKLQRGLQLVTLAARWWSLLGVARQFLQRQHRDAPATQHLA